MGVPVLSYHDVLLREDDISLLQSRNWINDQVIAFYFEYLMRARFHSTEEGPLFINGSMSYFLANGGAGDTEQMVASMKMHTRTLVLFAVNNNPFVDMPAGGSHWSLLVYRNGAFIHCDSSRGVNNLPAQELAKKVGPFFHASFNLATSFSLAETPQQVNGYDCGVYVMAISEAIAEASAASTKVNIEQSIRHIDPSNISALRQKCLQLIEALSADLVVLH